MLGEWQTSKLRGALAACLLLSLVGCFGDGPGGDSGNEQGGEKTVSGLFQGRLLDGHEISGVTAAIDRDGNTIYALRDDPNVERTTRAFDGTTPGAASPVRFSGDVLSDGARMPITFQAMLADDTLTAMLDGDRDLQLQRLARSGEGLSMDQLAGDYALVTPDNRVWRTVVDSDGTVTLGPASGRCNLQGRVSVPDPAVNVFHLTVPAAPCEPFNEGLSGLGSLDSLPPATELIRLDGRTGDQPLRLNLFASG